MAKQHPVVALSALAPGPPADCFALLAEKAAGRTRDGKPYYTCVFQDSQRRVQCKVWADSPTFAECEAEWAVGSVYKLRVVYSDHPQYGPQIDIVRLRPVTAADAADGFDPAGFETRSRFDPAVMLAELRNLVGTEVADAPLKVLTLHLLDATAAALPRLPASARPFYPFPGGWLEHVLNVTRNCILLADRYKSLYPDLHPPLNRDVVIVGAVLHDIGRVAELTPGGVGQPPTTTVAGHLHGHLILGRDMVRDAAHAFPELNPELLLLVEHVILSHLNTPAWGSVRLPAVPEVLILHHADDLDAKLEMYTRCLSRDTSGGDFTDADPVLKKPLWKGRTV